jgi:hypothetical protein
MKMRMFLSSHSLLLSTAPQNKVASIRRGHSRLLPTESLRGQALAGIQKKSLDARLRGHDGVASGHSFLCGFTKYTAAPILHQDFWTLVTLSSILESITWSKAKKDERDEAKACRSDGESTHGVSYFLSGADPSERLVWVLENQHD